MNINDYLFESLKNMDAELTKKEQKQLHEYIEKLSADMQPIYNLIDNLKKDEKQFNNLYVGLKKFLRGKKDG